MARAAIDTLSAKFDIIPQGELQQEWGVQITELGRAIVETRGDMGKLLTHEEAFFQNERWNGYGYNTDGVMCRMISKWKRVDRP